VRARATSRGCAAHSPSPCSPLSLAPAAARADQLQCNAKEVAASAVAYFPEGSYFLDFCSLCDAKVQVVRVSAARVVESCDFEVEVTGQVVLESTQPFADGYVPGKAQFVAPAGETEYRQQLDLAYAYVEVKENDFRWVGGQLGLQATVNTATIQLPPRGLREAGPPPPPQAGRPREARRPRPQPGRGPARLRLLPRRPGGARSSATWWPA
jgi:hypothetical protein